MYSILYSKAKSGNIKFWAGTANHPLNSDHAILTIKHGIISSDLTEKDAIKLISQPHTGVCNDTKVYGKNIGKKNETSPFQQALNELNSRISDKKRKGYVDNLSLVSEIKLNALGFPLPMLAKSWDDIKQEDIIYPIYVQPKYNGHRACILIRNISYSYEIIIYSRYGNLITSMKHIEEEIKVLGPYLVPYKENYTILDGELYCHDLSLQDQGSLITKEQKGSEQISFHMYDTFRVLRNSQVNSMEITDESFISRAQHLENLRHPINVKNIQNIVLAPLYEAKNFKEVLELRDKFIKNGFEGAIARRNIEKYEPGQRSSQLLKLKVTDDSEWEVIDVIQGQERDLNGVDASSTILLCKHKDGSFQVTAPGTIEEKRVYLKNKKDWIGKLITVKHFGYTNDGKPWHPVAIGWRQDI